MEVCLARPEAVTLIANVVAIAITVGWPYDEVASLILDIDKYTAQEDVLGEGQACESLLEEMRTWVKIGGLKVRDDVMLPNSRLPGH